MGGMRRLQVDQFIQTDVHEEASCSWARAKEINSASAML